MTESRIISDPFCPEDHVITDHADRRWLWRIESFLAVSATNNTQRELQVHLQRYLNATCTHHWHEREVDTYIAAHRQCLWCCSVEWLDEVAAGEQ